MSNRRTATRTLGLAVDSMTAPPGSLKEGESLALRDLLARYLDEFGPSAGEERRQRLAALCESVGERFESPIEALIALREELDPHCSMSLNGLLPPTSPVEARTVMPRQQIRSGFSLKAMIGPPLLTNRLLTNRTVSNRTQSDGT